MQKNALWSLCALLLLLGACNTPKQLAKKRNNYLTKAYKELKETLNEAEVIKLQDTVKVLFPEHLLFAVNSSTINPEIRPLMTRFAYALNKFSKTNMLINGHTDNTGSKAYNLQISKERAAAAKNILVEEGVDAARMLTWGLGMANPITDNQTSEGRRKNRRVEFILLYTMVAKNK